MKIKRTFLHELAASGLREAVALHGTKFEASKYATIGGSERRFPLDSSSIAEQEP